jgi:ribosome maturation factor RimP
VKEQNRHKTERRQVAPRAKPEEQIAWQVWAIAEPLCESMKASNWSLLSFIRKPQGRVLRLYIDKGGGITLDDCAAVSAVS